MNPSVRDLKKELLAKFEEVFSNAGEPDPPAESKPEGNLTPEQIEIAKRFHEQFVLTGVVESELPDYSYEQHSALFKVRPESDESADTFYLDKDNFAITTNVEKTRAA